eukprot:scaffold6.g2539.t1
MASGLDSLDFGLVSRPKSLKDMKDASRARAPLGAGAGAAAALPPRGPAARATAPAAQPSSAPWTGLDASGLEDLVARAASSSSRSDGPRSAAGSAGADAAPAAGLGLNSLFHEAVHISASSSHADLASTAPASEAAPDPPAGDDDPLALFGGPAPSSSGGAAVAARLLTVDGDGLLSGFAQAAAPPAAQAAAPPRAEAAAPPAKPPSKPPSCAGSPGAFSDFGGFQDAAPAPTPPAPRAAPAPQQPPKDGPLHAGIARASPSVTAAGVPAPPPAEARSGSFTASYGVERRDSATSQSKPRYKVFEYLDEQEGSGRGARGGGGTEAAGGAGHLTAPATRAGSGAGGGGVLDVAHHERPLDSVADMGHRAAKMLQSGTKWFVRASKTLVKQVQTNLHHAGHVSESGDGGAALGSQGHGRPTAETPPYYFDWAAQLARLSPASQAAALGALAEEDRLAVQRILDESTLGDSYMESPAYEGYARPPLPSGAAAAAGTNGARGERAEQPARCEEPGPRAAGRPGSLASPTRHSSRSSFVGEEAAPPPSYEEVQPSAGAAAQPLPRQQGSPPRRPAEQPRPAVPAQPAAAAHPADDLLGMHSPVSRQPAGAVPAAAAAESPPRRRAPAAPEDDLLGLSGNSGAAAWAAEAAGGSSSASAAIEEMFTVPKPGAQPPAAAGGAAGAAGAARAPARPAAARPSPSGSRSALDSMIDLGEGPAADTTGFSELYADAEARPADPNEPELRRQLRERRIAEKHARMAAQLAEKRARDEAEAAEKAGKVELRDTLRPRITAWTAGKKDNIRALLASLHTVLWEDSGWAPASMADMVDNARVKRMYMKANLVVHPDKVKQKGGTLEQVATADMVFDVLKVAWAKFEASCK